MHSHHSPQPCQTCHEWPDWARFLEARSNTIEVQNALIIEKLGEIMADLSALTDQVSKSTAVEASALTLIQGIAQRLTDAAGDPTAVQGLVDELNTSANSLAEAVAANTPAAPAA